MADAPSVMAVDGLVIRFALRRGIGAMLRGGASHFNAVDQVSFAVRPGEVLGLVGESGSGKTTIGKALLRLYEPKAGTIRYRDEDITHVDGKALRDIRPHLQMVFQDPLSSLNPRHSIHTALATPLLVHDRVHPDQVDDRVDSILRQVGLPAAFKQRFPHEMSGGQLQRVAIGRALILDPSLIVADEPVSKLDVSVRAKILNLFKDIQARLGIALVFITHDLRVARYLCDRIAVMYFGKLVEVAPTREIFARPCHPYTRALLGTIRNESSGPPLAGEAFNPTTDRQGCRFYSRCPMRKDSCLHAHPPMENVDKDHQVACYEWRSAAI
ncbi:MAG: ABC transporter ATP-binding protein [Alphaproteobacteria bacterium]|nr:ABC transporter ATP-binding protein [Alphaproteobacteria bacterium]